MRAELERIEIPGELGARERSWRVVESAFAAREHVPRRSRLPRVAAVALAVAALCAAALSPPGMAVLDEIRDVVGVERAQPALFSLPSPGRLLVTSDSGAWVVNRDGSRRLLGAYHDASWSPFGRFVVVAGENELSALEPDGDSRWSLARPDVEAVRWTGSETDTRIAYVDSTGIRVVAGDGTGDRQLVQGAHGPIAWRPGSGFVLAHVAAGGRVVLRDVATGRIVGRSERGTAPRALTWSDDGRRLLVVAPGSVRLLDDRGRLVRAESMPVEAGTFRPGSREVVLIRRDGPESDVVAWPSGRSLFRGTGLFTDVEWSPDGAWLLVGWPNADQWVFVPAAGGGRVEAAANLSEQFRSRAFPRARGWCCRP